MDAKPVAPPATIDAIDSWPGVVLRPIQMEDMDFLRALYATTREAEFAQVPWPQQAKRQFLDQQFDFQHRHYQTEYAAAEFLLIVAHAQPIGRLYLDRACAPWTIVDIALISQRRGQGIGTALLRMLLEKARAGGCGVNLHVEPFNPARRLYERLGFALIENRGAYDYLGWHP